ncbi:MAG: hypothetical protein HC770_09435 [Pseudanabaena sp. CRU_2_10]|nr:hypothetical protein [Pseudanabaena sp. CRU_2_10]
MVYEDPVLLDLCDRKFCGEEDPVLPAIAIANSKKIGFHNKGVLILYQRICYEQARTKDCAR